MSDSQINEPKCFRCEATPIEVENKFLPEMNCVLKRLQCPLCGADFYELVGDVPEDALMYEEEWES